MAPPAPPPSPVEAVINPNNLAVDDWVLISSEGGGHCLARITSVDFWPTINLREYDIERVSGQKVLWVMAGVCGINHAAMTFVPENHVEAVDAHHARTIAVPSLLHQLYREFDEADESGDDEDESDHDDSEPRRSKRARHSVEKLGAWVK